VKGTDAHNVLNLSGRGNCQPLPLQPCQAYSTLYYYKGSTVYWKIKDLYMLYKTSNTTTLSSLQQLFKEAPNGNPDATNLPSPSNPDPHSSEDPVPPKMKCQ